MKNGPDLAGGIGVEAGTCSLGKGEFQISTSICIVTAAQLTTRAAAGRPGRAAPSVGTQSRRRSRTPCARGGLYASPRRNEPDDQRDALRQAKFQYRARSGPYRGSDYRRRISSTPSGRGWQRPATGDLQPPPTGVG
jgi:hypothetical protein